VLQSGAFGRREPLAVAATGTVPIGRNGKFEISSALWPRGAFAAGAFRERG
jgi:hypothetical protein